ncbi:hypothetical protein N7523_010210 [Penicillium sp. IBT 18751x]|nr:hypothetical protein N7523_010210 [Penicillium sp. IBT 18751x]
MVQRRGSRPRSSRVQLTFEDSKGHAMRGLFPVSETLRSLRLRWLRQALELTEEEAKEKEERCHIAMIELLGSLRTLIMDVEGASLSCIEDLKDKAVFIVSWHWETDCDGTLEPTSLQNPF